MIIGTNYPDFTGERLAAFKKAAPDAELRILKKEFDPSELADCEVLFGFFDRALLKHATSLAWFHTQSAGVESYLDPAVFARGGVALTNSSGAYGPAISEHMLAMLFSLLYRLPVYRDRQKARIWLYAGRARSLSGLRATVIGYGDIGSNLGKRLNALGARVTAVVRTARGTPSEAEALYTSDRLAEALADADVVALALPDTPDTRSILSRPIIEGLKPGAIVVNAGRGSAIDQEALIDGLKSGALGGAGLDVASPEPLPADSPLWELDNVVLTPHISGGVSNPDTLARVFDIFLENLKNYLSGKPFSRLIDAKKGY